MTQLASTDDVAALLGRQISLDEGSRVVGLLDEASAIAAAWMRTTPNPVPDGVRIAVSRMAARALTANAGSESGVSSVSMTAGPFGFTRGFAPDATAGGVYLSRQDKAMLRPHAVRGRAGSVPTW